MKKKNFAKGLMLAFCLFFGIMLAGTQTAQPVKAAVKKTTTVTKAAGKWLVYISKWQKKIL